ncbi:MAG: nitrile hydratase subunit alpha [Labedaea sp.]
MTHVHHSPTAPMNRRVGALERLLVGRGAITTEQVDGLLELFSREMGAHNGARYVARAWVDDEFRGRLLADAPAVLREFGHDLRGTMNRELGRLRLVVVENTTEMHNLVVCTLCSCYPVPLLGPPPSWYRSNSYRARAVREPRAVLAEFGVALDPSVRIRVWDSTAESRYLVLPLRPAGTEHLSEDDLADLVTPQSLVGAGLPKSPG